jgi:hypothetical protein
MRKTTTKMIRLPDTEGGAQGDPPGKRAEKALGVKGYGIG